MTKKESTSEDGLARRDVLKLAGAAVVGIGGVAIAGSPALAAGGVIGGGTVQTFALSADGIASTPFRQLVALRMRSGKSDEGAADAASPPFEAVLLFGGDVHADVYAWFTAAAGGKKTGRRAARIIGFDASLQPLVAWNLTGAFPSEILASSASSTFEVQLTLGAESIVRANP